MTIATVLRRLGLLLSCTFLVALQASAAVLYVNLNNATPAAPYADWNTAATNIQDAVDAASVGDTVMVTNGMYQTGGRVVAGALTNRVVVNKAITLSSVNGPGVTAICGYQMPQINNGYIGIGDSAIRCVYLASGATLMGFTVTNGATRYEDTNSVDASGAGVWCQSSNCVVSGCIITNNIAWQFGGGIYQGAVTNCGIGGNVAWWSGGGACLATLDNCMLSTNMAYEYGGGADQCVLRQCVITNNLAWSYGGGSSRSAQTNCSLVLNFCSVAGAGAYLGTLTDCILTRNFIDNSYSTGGGGAYSATLNNCVLTANRSDIGGGAYGGVLNNCTLTGNYATNSGGGAAAATLNNCIVYFNTAASNANFDSTCTLNYCCTTPLPSIGVSNITMNPQLADVAHISAGSPCRGAGNAAYATGVDVDGENWLNPPSIGCDELHGDSVIGSLSPSFTLSYTSVLTGFTVYFSGSILGETTGATWDFGDGTVISNEPYVSHSWAAVGDYPVVLTAFNQTYPTGIASTVTVHVVSRPIHYVDLNNESPAAPYSTWATAATTIQDAVDAAFVPGALVLVNDGHYQSGARWTPYGVGTNRVVATKILTIHSVNGPTVTSIDGGNAMGGVYLTNGAALVGFTVWNCSNRVAAAVWSSTGGAVVSNCIFTLNPNDGGAYKATVYNSIFSNGGGPGTCILYNCVITNCPNGLWGCTANNCLIVNNFATDGGGASGCTLNNCTLVGNAADNVGGGAYHSTLNNCISYYNWGLVGSNYDSTCTLNNCCTWPLPATGVGNFTNAPAFMNLSTGDFRLQPNSPCINAGNNAFVIGATDFAGNPRISGGTVDMGAYEFQNPASIISYAWLQQFGLATDGSADFVDTDGDGVNNYQEWRAGTDPTNPLSVLMLLYPYTSGTNIVVPWTTVPNRSYYLQRSSNLGVPGSFLTIATGIPGVSGTMFYVDTNGPAPASVFYRVGVQ